MPRHSSNGATESAPPPRSLVVVLIAALLVAIPLATAGTTHPDWDHEATWTPSEPVDRDAYGQSMAVSDDGNAVIVGAPIAWTESLQPGYVDVYENTSSGWERAERLTGGAESFHDNFGAAVAVEGGDLFVGASEAESSSGIFAGAVYVYERTDNGWMQTQRLTSGDAVTDDDGSYLDRFGGALAVDGDRLLVGAEGDESNGDPDAGAVYVFERTSLGWTQTARLTSSDTIRHEDPDGFSNPVFFGRAVALTGDTALVGAPYEDRVDPDRKETGAVYVFKRAGGSWTETTRLVNAGAARDDLYFGASLGLDAEADTAVVGEPSGWDASSTQSVPGWVHVFEHANGAWEQRAKLSVPEDEAEIGDDCCEFGKSVAVSSSGLRILAGAPKKSESTGTTQDPGAWTGAGYVLDRTTDGWALATKITAPDAHRQAGDVFGETVAMTPDGILSLAGATEYWQCGGSDCGAEGDNGEAHLFNGPPAPENPVHCLESGPVSTPVHNQIEPKVGETVGEEARQALHEANCEHVRSVETAPHRLPRGAP